MSIDKKDKLLLREIVKALMLEQGDRGLEYENTLVSALLSCGELIVVSNPAGNDTSISDLGFSVCGVDVASEVKLSATDLLGSFKKPAFTSLTWDGSVFGGTVNEDHELADIAQLILTAMQQSQNAASVMKTLDPLKPYKSLPWNLIGPGATFGRAPESSDKESFPNDPIPTDDKYIVYALLRNVEERFPVPNVDSRGNPVSSDRIRKKQITSGHEIMLSSTDIARLISAKPGPNGASTSYIIVGDGDENSVSGQIFSLRNDPLNIGAPPFNGVAGVQIRFRPGGGKSRNYGFDLGTKGVPGQLASGGLRFKSAQELCDIFLSSPVCAKKGQSVLGNRDKKMYPLDDLTQTHSSQQTPREPELDLAGLKRSLRSLIHETLLLEELTATDKKEIEKIARKQSKKEITKVIGNDLSKTIQKEVEKIFKNKATKEEIVTVCQTVMKKLYKALSTSHTNVIDSIRA